MRSTRVTVPAAVALAASLALTASLILLASCRATPASTDRVPATPRSQAAATPPDEHGLRDAGVAGLELDPKSDLERPLADGERHRYTLELRSDEYLHLVVEQRGVDVALELSAPQGQILSEVDSPTWRATMGTEVLELVAVEPGRYRLAVHAVPGSRSGAYRMRIVAWRAATGKDHDRAAAMQALARGHSSRRQGGPQGFRDAIEMYRATGQHWAAAGEPLQQASALRWIGTMYRALGELREAIQWIRQSLEISRSVDGGGEQTASNLWRLGRLYRQLGEESNALNSLKAALALARELHDRPREASYLNNIAVTYLEFGRVRQALRFYEDTLALCREICEQDELATTQTNLGAFYGSLGRFKRASILLEDALRLSRQAGNVRTEARTLSQLAAVQRRLARPGEALETIENSLALQDAQRNSRGRASTLKELGRTQLALGDRKAAMESFEQSLEIYQQLQDHKGEAQIRSELGWLFIEMGDAERAMMNLDLALRFFRVTGSRDEASVLHAVARAERLRGDLEAALRRIKRAIEIVESLRSRADISDLRSSFLAHKHEYYELYIDLLVDLHLREPAAGYDALAFAVSQQRRTRSLLEDLIEARGESVRDPDPELLDRKRELQRAIDVKDRELERLRREVASRDDVVRAERQLEELLMARERLQSRITAARTEVSRAPPRLDLLQVQELLDPDTLLLEITLGTTRSFLWLVTPSTFELHVLPERTVIEKRAQSAYRLLAQSRDRRTEGRLELLTGELSRLLLEPVASRLGKQRLLLVSDAALQYVPFAALPIPHGHPAGPKAGPKPELLVTVHEIVQVPSMSVLSLLRQQASAMPPQSKTLAVVADPVFDPRDLRLKSRTQAGAGPGVSGLPPLSRLPGSGAEAEAILSLVPEAKRFAALGSDASHATVLSGVLADYRYVHFATHSLFDPERPEVSGLALSRFDQRGQPIEASILRAHEVLGLDLQVEMVVLSACQTGLGLEIRGEGLVGLTQSFLSAGAPRVLVSFWPVDDQGTAELMVQFYRGILERGLRPAASLRRAQLSMLRQRHWRAPYYWAGFFLQGEWR